MVLMGLGQEQEKKSSGTLSAFCRDTTVQTPRLHQGQGMVFFGNRGWSGNHGDPCPVGRFWWPAQLGLAWTTHQKSPSSYDWLGYLHIAGTITW